MAQREKVINFEDGSMLKVELLEGGSIYVILQAKHLGSEIKYTAASVKLAPDKAVDLVNWLGDELVKELSNE